jgi:FtsH-binding integral membrane protein
MMETQFRAVPAVQQQEIVRSFMQRVYIWMTGGLSLTGFIAYYTAQSPSLMPWLAQHPGALYGMMFATLGIVIAMSALINKISATAAGAMFIVYAALNGFVFSTLFLIYAAESIAQVFFITAGMFGAMSIYGFVTKRDLTGWGSFLTMGLIGIIITMVVNIFLKSSAVDYAVSFIGVFIFLGLTAYDTQKLKGFALQDPEGAQRSEKPAIIGALSLYLDFINIFLMLLRIFGNRR